MKIAVLASGGDGAGMNMCLYKIMKALKKHSVYLFARGYTGLINNELCDFGFDYVQKHCHDGGIVIKTSRCPEFRTEAGIEKAMQTYKDLGLDSLVIMGGNGSLRGAKELVVRGANVLFVPCTIDNDVFGSEYCIGFDTACKNCVDFIENVNTTMQSFDRIAIYETMGRECPAIAKAIYSKVQGDYLFVDETNTIEDCVKTVAEKFSKTYAPKIILRENLIDSKQLLTALNNAGYDAKVCVVGYLQRGGNPTKLEEKNATMFANKIAEQIQNLQKNKIIMVKNGEFVAENIEKYV